MLGEQPLLFLSQMCPRSSGRSSCSKRPKTQWCIQETDEGWAFDGALNGDDTASVPTRHFVRGTQLRAPCEVAPFLVSTRAVLDSSALVFQVMYLTRFLSLSFFSLSSSLFFFCSLTLFLSVTNRGACDCFDSENTI